MPIAKSALAEANGFAQTILTALKATVVGSQGQSGAALYWSCGNLLSAVSMSRTKRD